MKAYVVASCASQTLQFADVSSGASDKMHE
jgi:hypothetical protein